MDLWIRLDGSSGGDGTSSVGQMTVSGLGTPSREL
jgi:hypothetical protein